jgi:hypothetical protein
MAGTAYTSKWTEQEGSVADKRAKRPKFTKYNVKYTREAAQKSDLI